MLKIWETNGEGVEQHLCDAEQMQVTITLNCYGLLMGNLSNI